MALVAALRYLPESPEKSSHSRKRPYFLVETHLFDEIPRRSGGEWSGGLHQTSSAEKRSSPVRRPADAHGIYEIFSTMMEASSGVCQLSVCKQTKPETEKKGSKTASTERPAAPAQEVPDSLELGRQDSSTEDHPDSKDSTDEKDLTPSGNNLLHPDFTSEESSG